MDSRGAAQSLLIKLANALARVLQIALMVAGLMIAAIYGMALFGDGGFGKATLLWLVLQYAAVVVHELGHYAGARLGGMKVSVVQIATLQFIPLRRGFRWRWMPQPKKSELGGYVMAYAHPARPARQARWLFTAGGPVANLLVAALLAGLGELLRPHAIGWLCLTFAANNAAMGLANLVPRMGTLPSDGLQLWSLWRAGPDYVEDVTARLTGASLAGCTADRLPEPDLVELEGRGAFGRLYALWYRLKADQNRGEWAQAVARQDTIDELVREIDPRRLIPWNEFLQTLRAEIAFSRAVAAKDGAALGNDLLPPRQAWYMPHFRPRCLALQAALAGDEAQCAQWLDACRRQAEQSNDAALPISEAMIAAHIRALLGRSAAAASAAAEPA